MKIEAGEKITIELTREEYSSLMSYILFGADINPKKARGIYHELRKEWDKWEDTY